MPPNVRLIPHDGPRVETGAVRFGDDWPGLFIRGDNAAGVMFEVDGVLALLRAAGVTDLETRLATQHLREIAGLIRGDVIVGGWPKGGPP